MPCGLCLLGNSFHPTRWAQDGSLGSRWALCLEGESWIFNLPFPRKLQCKQRPGVHQGCVPCGAFVVSLDLSGEAPLSNLLNKLT